jgi:hypothetical protein
MQTGETPLPLRTEGIAQLLLQAVIVPGERTSEGKLIEAVTIPWFDIIESKLGFSNSSRQVGRNGRRGVLQSTL